MARPVLHSHGAQRFHPAVRRNLRSNPKGPEQCFAHKSVDGELVVLSVSEGCFLTVQKRAHEGEEQAGTEHNSDSDQRVEILHVRAQAAYWYLQIVMNSVNLANAEQPPAAAAAEDGRVHVCLTMT